MATKSRAVAAESAGSTATANGKRHATQQSLNSAVKSICDIMRRSNVAFALTHWCRQSGTRQSHQGMPTGSVDGED
jgi:hypothetical protein